MIYTYQPIRDQISRDLAAACATEIDREDDILTDAILSGRWSATARMVADHRDANGTTHSISCHRDH